MDNNIEVIEEKKDKGFTLIELLIVIVILGILATVVVFAVRGITDKGQDSACQADNQTLSVAVEAYYAQYGTTATVSEGALLAAGFLRELSTNYNVEPDGTLTVQDTDCN
jgi:prepilin-type N-terminal cleavage/methylation domain-containing protein